MKNYITLINNQPFVSSLHIAEAIGYPHRNIITMIRKHLEDLQKFDLVAFEMQPRLQGQHGGGSAEYALLNERQATLLLTYMRNKPIVKRFKIALVKQFYELQQQRIDVTVLQQELLKAKPRWKEIARYKDLDLQPIEIARLLEVSKDTVRRDLRLMEKCGIVEPPKNLSAMQQIALPLIDYNSNKEARHD